MHTFPGMKKITRKNFFVVSKKGLSETTKSVIWSALEQNIEVFQLFTRKPMFLLKKGKKIVWVQNLLTSLANPVGINIARDKNLTKIFLESLGYPTSPGIIVNNVAELMQAADKIGFPIVIKPMSSGEGKGVTVNVKTKTLLRNSFAAAKKFGKRVLVEKHIEGDYYRITYIADGSFAVTKNVAAFIMGDGAHSAEELIKRENSYNKERRLGGRLKKIKVSGTTKRFLISKRYTLESIIPQGERLPICFSGHGGGEYIDVTDVVHPYYVELARTVVQNLALPIVSIDIIAASIKRPLGKKNGGVIIEINGTSPALDFHKQPTMGAARDLAPYFVRYILS